MEIGTAGLISLIGGVLPFAVSPPGLVFQFCLPEHSAHRFFSVCDPVPDRLYHHVLFR